MKVDKKATIIFAFIISFLTVSAWEFIQSEFFGNYLTKYVNQYLSKDIKEKIKFEKVEIRVLPPGLSIQKVQVKSTKNDEYSITGFLDELRVNFNLIALSENKLSIKKIKLVGGYLGIDHKIKDQAEELDLKNIETIIWEKIPENIRDIELKNLDLKSNYIDVYIRRIKSKFYKKITYLDGALEDIDCKLKECSMGKSRIDEVIIDAEISKNRTKIAKFLIKQDLSEVSINLSGQGSILSPKNFIWKGGVTSVLNIEDLHSLSSRIQPYNGLIEFSMNAKGKGLSIEGELKGRGRNFRSTYVNINNIEFEMQKIGSQISVLKAKINDQDGFAEIKQPFLLYDINPDIPFELKIDANVKNLHSHKFLYSLRDVLNPLSTYITGNVKVDLNKDRVVFKTENSNAAKVELDIDNKEILSYENVDIKAGVFRVKMDGSLVEMKILGKLNETEFNSVGSVGSGKIDILTNFSQLSLDDLTPVAGVKLYGEGRAQMRTYGPLDDTVFKITHEIENTKYIGLNLSSVSGQTSIYLNEKFVEFKDIKSKNDFSTHVMNGVVAYDKEVTLDLKVRSPKFTYDDALWLLEPISSPLTFLPRGIDGTFMGDVKVWGPVKDNSYSIVGAYDARELLYGNETFKGGGFKIELLNKNLRFSDAYLEKGKRKITGETQFNMESKEYDFAVDGRRLSISDFYIIDKGTSVLNGLFDFSIRGQGGKSELDYTIRSSLKNSSIEQKSVADSKFLLNYKNGRYTSQFNIMGNDIRGEIDIRNPKSNKESKAKVSIDSKDIKKLITSVFPHNSKNNNIYGEMKSELEFKGVISKAKSYDLNIEVEKLFFEVNNQNLKIDPELNNFRIKNGEILDRKIVLIDGSDFIDLSGQGDLGEKFKIENKFKLNSSLIQVVNSKILKVNGSSFGELIFESDAGVANGEMIFNSNGEDITLFIEGVPASFEKVRYRSRFINNSMFIDHITGTFGGGEFSSKGVVEFRFPFPEVAIDYKLLNSKLRIFKNTNLWISSQGGIRGTQPPYSLVGDISIVNAMVYDEIEDFSSGKSSKFSTPYLPEIERLNSNSLLDLDLNIKTIRPIQLKNSLAEIKFHTDFAVFGTIDSPRVRGSMNMVNGSGKFFFKNNDFLLTRGRLKFDGGYSMNPDLDFEGISKISEYSIILKVIGKAKDYQLELDSSPVLPESDILGLLATGLTSEASSKLSDSERESVTSLGIGAIIFDRFKINQELQSALGVNLSITPEVEDDDDNYINEASRGRSKVRSKSSTKVEVKKKISNKIDLSVSSVVGGEVGSKQEMNINYDVSENVSVEGVYEVKSTEDTEATDEGDSVGVDFKWRIEF